jgi:glycosyltransferase involved in cell wall biosynthesis
MNESTVSVVIPTLGDPLLADALDGVAAQTYENIEIVVVDGSEDGIADDLRDRIDVYEYQEPRGLSAARNRGIDLASGEYVAFLDEDDVLTTESIASRVDALEDGFDVAYGDWYEVGPAFALGDAPDPERLRTTLPVRDQARQHVYHFVEQGLRPSAMMIRRSCFETHRYDTNRKIAEDFQFRIRVVRDFRVCKVDTPVLYYRIREGTLSRADRDAYRVEKLAGTYDLAARYPELQPYLDRVVAREWYLHGREKLGAGKTRSALHAATKSLATDPRPRNVALLATLCLPFPVASKDRVFRGLERFDEVVERVADVV